MRVIPLFLLIFLVKENSLLNTTTTPCSNCTVDTTETLPVSNTTAIYDDEEEVENSTLSSTSEIPSQENTTQLSTNVTLQSNVSTIAPTLIPTTPKPTFPSREVEAVPCTCDLLVDVCDIGCCCDADCSTEDRRAFSHCSDNRPVFPPEPRLCHRLQWLYQDNTAVSVAQYQTGLMCLHADNVPQRYWLQNPKVITTLDDFSRFESRAKTLPWPTISSLTHPDFHTGLPYKSGDLIWALKNNITMIPFHLHTNIVGAYCEGNKNILFLENWKSKCVLYLTESCQANHGSVNSTHFFSSLQLLSSPMDPLINQTEPWLTIQPFLCSSQHKERVSCHELTESVEPSLSALNCNNSVVKAQYVLQHNGTEGIVLCKVFLWLDSVPINQPVSQELEVQFEWVGTSTHPLHRSGRPGYLQSAPLLTGILVENRNSVISFDHGSWLNALSAKSDGQCGDNRLVLFNDNMMTQCSLPLYASNFSRSGCMNLSRSITELFIGNLTLINNLTVGAFGDSEWGTLTDWVPVIFKDVPSNGKWFNDLILQENTTEKSLVPYATDIGACGGISTSLNIHIIWSSVGSFASPQSKVLGVRFAFGPTQTLQPQGSTSLQLITTVKFTDVTPTPKSQFAPPPKYEIRLPKDFFYPLFVSSNCQISYPMSSLLSLILFLLFI